MGKIKFNQSGISSTLKQVATITEKIDKPPKRISTFENFTGKQIQKQQHDIEQLDDQLNNPPKKIDKQLDTDIPNNNPKIETKQTNNKQQIDQKVENIQEDTFYWMTKKQIKLLNYILNLKSPITKLRDIETSTGIPYGTIRRSIDGLIKNQLILSKTHFRNGGYRGIKFTLNEKLCKKFQECPKNR